jgi:hypothetical protein
VFERITDAFVALDRDWIYTYVNGKARRLFGRTPWQLIAAQSGAEFPEGVGQPSTWSCRKAMAEQQPAFLEEYYPPYGKWFENRIYPSPEGLTSTSTTSPSASWPSSRSATQRRPRAARAQTARASSSSQQGTGVLFVLGVARPARAAARGHRLRADPAAPHASAARDEEQRYLDNIVTASEAHGPADRRPARVRALGRKTCVRAGALAGVMRHLREDFAPRAVRGRWAAGDCTGPAECAVRRPARPLFANLVDNGASPNRQPGEPADVPSIGARR